ncbi:hypothetical protein COK00_23170 [Bacillus cereus]|uniref:Uncharacterized protein n=1 Tax=Bacillus cereus TaxID=1396 RepID=A0A2B3ZB73_BACCE|nr:hypothetical protein CN455_04950 [Bacillus cereus]PFB18006.1 hypothetical protein CN399_05855 [Bacillus cereus]PFC71126.1 hypothetical protein CN290_23995 [Bacillus cereus]PFD75830.1 hypothetical protein CN301_06200 [Bacillus cereus]PFK31129.1 hypothetical protein COJ18_25450 [Bacillus cereus]
MGGLIKRLGFLCYISILKEYICSFLDYLFLIIIFFIFVIRILKELKIWLKRRVFKKIKMFSI